MESWWLSHGQQRQEEISLAFNIHSTWLSLYTTGLDSFLLPLFSLRSQANKSSWLQANDPIESLRIPYEILNNSFLGSFSQVNLQRRLFPKPEDSLSIPLIAAWVQPHIEMEQDFCHNEAHLVVCQIATNTIPRSEAEWAVYIAAVVIKRRTRISCGFR
jgi:hypothetical protein